MLRAGKVRPLLLPGLLLALALALRMDWHLAFRELPIYTSPAVDEALHWQWAQDLAAGCGSPELPYFRAPLYPWLLGALRAAGLGLAGLRWAGTLLGLASLLLLTWTCRRCLGPRAALAALALAGLSATWIYYEPQLLLEHTVLFLLLAATAAWLRLHERPPGPADLACGLALGLAAIARPNALLLAPLATLLLLALAEPLPRRLQRLGMWAAGWLPPLALVAALNGWPASGVLVASQGGVNLWIGNNAQADGRSALLPGFGPAWERADASSWAREESGHPLTPGGESAFYAGHAQRWVLEHPAAAARLLALKAALLLDPQEQGNNTSPSVLARRRAWMAALLPLSWWLLLLPGLAGLALGFPRHAGLRRWVLGALLLYGGSFLPFFIAGRFRLPLLPLLALPAADLAAWAWGRWRSDEPPLPLPAPSGLRRNLALVLALALPVAATLWTRAQQPPGLREGQEGWQAFQLGNAWLRLHEADSARACYDRALRLAPALHEVRLNLGLLEASRRPARAESLYRAELALDPRSAKAWNNLGGLWLEQGRESEAAEAFRQALALRPGLADAAWNLGLARARQGLAALAAGDSAAAAAALKDCGATPYRGRGYERLARALGGPLSSGSP